MKKKFLLTNNETTTKIEEYIIDLFKLYFTIYPKEIPHRDDMGVDFNLSGLFKDELEVEIKVRINDLIHKIKEKYPGVQIEIKTLDIIDEETVKLILTVNSSLDSDAIILNFMNRNNGNT